MNSTGGEIILETEELAKSFGGLVAVAGLDLEVRRGQVVGLIGPNGAGKTTSFALISGFLRPDHGRVRFQGDDITGLRPHKIARRGLARTFQLVQPFPTITTLENVMIGSFTRERSPEKAREQALAILERVGLGDKAETLAGGINLAQRKRLETARALATCPQLLLLDEVMAGLNPTEIEEMINLVRQLAAEGIAVVMIEHVMKAVMSVCSNVVVLHHGEKIAEGTPAEITENPRVIEAYFGEELLFA